eukprot:4570017-Ditylum_brightwellii.AAC.1
MSSHGLLTSPQHNMYYLACHLPQGFQFVTGGNHSAWPCTSILCPRKPTMYDTGDSFSSGDRVGIVGQGYSGNKLSFSLEKLTASSFCSNVSGILFSKQKGGQKGVSTQ